MQALGYQPIPEAIINLRSKHNLSRKDLAETLGVHPAAVWQWEKQNNGIREETLNKMAGLFEVPIETIAKTRELHKGERPRPALNDDQPEARKVSAPSAKRPKTIKTKDGIVLRTVPRPAVIKGAKGVPINGARLMQIRLERRLTQSSIARAMGLNSQSIDRWEKGDNGISPQALEALATVLEIDPADLSPCPIVKRPDPPPAPEVPKTPEPVAAAPPAAIEVAPGVHTAPPVPWRTLRAMESKRAQREAAEQAQAVFERAKATQAEASRIASGDTTKPVVCHDFREMAQALGMAPPPAGNGVRKPEDDFRAVPMRGPINAADRPRMARTVPPNEQPHSVGTIIEQARLAIAALIGVKQTKVRLRLEVFSEQT